MEYDSTSLKTGKIVTIGKRLCAKNGRNKPN